MSIGKDNVPNGPMSIRELAVETISGVIERSINRRIEKAKLAGIYDPDKLALIRSSTADDIENMLIEMLEIWEMKQSTEVVQTAVGGNPSV
jgi:hypothetical protein